MKLKLSALSPKAHFSKVLKTIKNKSSLIQDKLVLYMESSHVSFQGFIIFIFLKVL